MTHAAYLRVIRAKLPAEAFRPRPDRLLHIGMHTAVIFIGCAALSLNLAWYWCLIISIGIGHSLGCFGLLGHDLTHKTIIKSKWLRYPLEIFMWGLIWMSPTMWNHVHNQTHHIETNTSLDPDRRWFSHEKSWLRKVHSRLFFPHRNGWIWSPLVFVYFFIYVISNNVSAFMTESRRVSILPHKRSYSSLEKTKVAFELCVAFIMQFGIYRLSGSQLDNYIWASPVALFVGATLVMSYIFTNHLLHPCTELVDPVLSTTSVVVPKYVNWFHSNMSYHTEHHLFPGMNPEWYPMVSEILIKEFPDRYHRMPFLQAWRELYRQDEFWETASQEAV